MFTISRTEPIAIYGGGQIGKTLAARMLSHKYNVVGIIDRNPNAVKESPVTVYSAADYYEAYGDTFVWVSLGRGLEHPPTAQLLNKIGFKRILFLPLYLRSKFAKQMILSYNAFFIGEYDAEICSYDELFYTIADDYMISKTGEFIIAIVPKEHLWTANPRIILNDISNPYHVMFTYNEQYGKDANGFDKPVSELSFSKEVETQSACCQYYELYENAMYDFDFWRYGAIPVTLADKNHFNIVDGGHRALYLASKGINGIPCRMLYREWKAYFCQEKAQALMRYCKQLRALPSKVVHPAFLWFPVVDARDEAFDSLLEDLNRA